MLSFLKKKQSKNEIIAAPISGKTIASSEIPDDTFAEEMLGKGIAIVPTDGRVYSPVDGSLTFVPKSKHAVSITSSEGTEILIHFGIDTVSLDGVPFDIKVEQGSDIKKGDLLMEVNIQAILDAGLSTITPVIICNSDDFKDVIKKADIDVAVGDDIMEIVR